MNDTNNGTAGKQPDYLAYSVTNAKDGKGYFNKVGAAWLHKDGKGYDIQLESVPVNGRVTLREQRQEQLSNFQEAEKNEGMENHIITNRSFPR